MNDPPKKRRIHLNNIECAAYSSTEEGSRALTNPSSIPKSSRRRNTGLHPHTSKGIASLSKSPDNEAENQAEKQRTSNSCQSSFDKQARNQFVSGKEFFASYSSSRSSCPLKRRSKNPVQSNSLLNYFSLDKTAESTSSNVTSKAGNVVTVSESTNLLNANTEDEDMVFDFFHEEERKKGLSQEVSLEGLFQAEIKCDEMPDVTCITEDISNAAEGSDHDLYGLLGTGNIISTGDGNTEPDYFQQLPTHIFELILCHLPFLDLMLNLKRVAKYWNEVISNEKFLFWRKKYFKLKSKKIDGVWHEVQAICVRLNMDNIRDCLHGLIRYMKEFNFTPASDMHQNLKRHAKYKWAEDLITHRVVDCVKNGIVHPWSIVASLVVVSETVWDVYDIFRYLLHPESQCPVPDLLECLYCIATFLFYYQMTHQINHGLHYRVYYAIYTYQTQWKGRTDDITVLKEKVAGQQSILRYSLSSITRLTHEQMLIANHQLKPGQVVKIVAFAGTGKTSTLIEYTALRPNLKFLNIMYNKSVCEHAKTCFPPNVECRTAHSLAWAAVGRRYIRKLTSSIKPLHIMPLLKNLPKGVGERYRYAYSVLMTVEEFMATANEFITIVHTPATTSTDGEPRALEPEERVNIAKEAENLWNQMIDLNSRAPIVHDVYLKLYQLSQPCLSSYNCILVDEAQDCNGAMLHIVLSQQCPKILVGDPNQQIYAFRGATNALDKVISTHTYYLTQSFRFGPEIAYISSCALEVLKKVSNKTLVGGTQPGSVLGKKEGQLAVITRTNVTLFNEAVRLCCSAVRRHGEPSNVLGCFAGGIKGYNLDQIVDIQKLMSNDRTLKKNEINDKFVKRFSSFNALNTYAQNAKDANLLAKIKLVLQHHENIPKYVEIIKEKCQYSLDMANVVFTTAHKSKGLEFDTVSITDDFSVGNVPYSAGNINIHAALQEEFNILYVAITRAKKCLCIPTCVYYMLLGAQEKFEYLVRTKDLQETEGSVINCYSCNSDVLLDNKNPFILARKELILSNDRRIEKGFLCTQCATSPIFVPSFPNSNFATQMTRPIEDFSHESTCQLVGPLLSSNDLEREEKRKSPLKRHNTFLAIVDENFAENVFFLI